MSNLQTLNLIEEEANPQPGWNKQSSSLLSDQKVFSLTAKSQEFVGDSGQSASFSPVRKNSSESIELKKLQLLQKYRKTPKRKRSSCLFQNTLKLKVKERSGSFNLAQSASLDTTACYSESQSQTDFIHRANQKDKKNRLKEHLNLSQDLNPKKILQQHDEREQEYYLKEQSIQMLEMSQSYKSREKFLQILTSVFLILVGWLILRFLM